MKNGLGFCGRMSIITVTMALVAVIVVGCSMSDSSRVSTIVSQEADNFGVVRKFTLINLRDSSVVMEVTGVFSVQDNTSSELVLVCKLSEETYRKHMIEKAEGTTYIIEDLGSGDLLSYPHEVVYHIGNSLGDKVEDGVGEIFGEVFNGK